MTHHTPQDGFDVAVLGSTVCASLFAASLSRSGLRVVLYRGGFEPRAPRGSTTVPYTSELFEWLADHCQLPEARALALFRTGPESVTTTSGRKECLSFAHVSRRHVSEHLQFVVPSEHDEWHVDLSALDDWALGLVRSTDIVIEELDVRPITRWGGQTWQIGDSRVRASFLVDAAAAPTSGDDHDWWSIELTRSVPTTSTARPAVRHAVPWSNGTTLAATEHGVIQMARRSVQNDGSSLVTLWATVQRTHAGSDAADTIRRLFGNFAPVDEVMESQGKTVDVVIAPAFSTVEQRTDLPLLLVGPAAGQAPQMGPYPRILDTGCDYAAGRSVAV